MRAQHHLKAMLIIAALANALCIGVAYIAAYQATARPQPSNLAMTLGQIQIGTELDFLVYLAACDSNRSGHIGIILRDEQSPDTDKSPGVRIPTAPLCP